MSAPLDSDRTGEPGLTDFEKALGSLRPASRIQRDQILFRAGQQQAQSASRPHWSARSYWPAIAASLAVVTFGQWVMLARRPTKEIQVVYVQVPVQQSPAFANTPEKPDSEVPALAATDDAGDFVPQAPKSYDRPPWDSIRNRLDSNHATPVIALAPTEHPLTAARTLQINVRKFNDIGDSL